MSDIEINLDEAKAFLSSLQDIYQPYVKAAIESTTAAEIEEAALSLTGEQRRPGIIINLGSSSAPSSTLWNKVLDEVYDFLCTKSKEYRDERLQGANHFQNLVHVIATAVGATVSIGVAILTGLVSMALVLVAKIGRNAWCKQYKAGG